MATNRYSGIPMDHMKVGAALLQAGVDGLTEETLDAGKLLQYRGNFNLVPFLVKIFVKTNGKCTIGSGSNIDKSTYDSLADAIANFCRYGQKERLELAVPNFEIAHQVPLIEYLKSLGAKVESDSVQGNYRMLRVKGPHGDILTVKFYTNSTLQLQGSHALLAVWALDFLRTVLPLDQMLEHQRAVYKIPGTIESLKKDLIARVPNVHDALVEEVRIQLSSAFALTKAGAVLEDYTALAFPALKGLEGFCFQLLRDKCNFHPAQKSKLSEYFDNPYAKPVMRVPHSDGVPSEVQALLVQCYEMWRDQRHRLFHMDGTVETSRILEDRADAVSIVNGVLDAIDQGYAKILMLEGKP